TPAWMSRSAVEDVASRGITAGWARAREPVGGGPSRAGGPPSPATVSSTVRHGARTRISPGRRRGGKPTGAPPGRRRGGGGEGGGRGRGLARDHRLDGGGLGCGGEESLAGEQRHQPRDRLLERPPRRRDADQSGTQAGGEAHQRRSRSSAARMRKSANT